jgi:hypothetical protein
MRVHNLALSYPTGQLKDEEADYKQSYSIQAANSFLSLGLDNLLSPLKDPNSSVPIRWIAATIQKIRAHTS